MDFRRFKWRGVEAVVMDDHHWAFYLWWEALERGLIEKGASLLHVDQHKDMRAPAEGFLWENFERGDLEKVLEYTEKKLEVGNYIVPAIESGLIGEVQFVTGETAMEDMSFLDKKNKILNLDLDIFVPELGLDFDRAKGFLEKQLEGSSFVTIAKSPGFIDQDLAEEFLQKLIG